ncbi:tRNA (adenine(58)-N(1))-methyltransferase non-catalytic subunit trm6 [Chytridiales sp. JEL 0842]|nr:tRNA (adenine(58)-N(1))-methyltransferase non-catalytic subunit trm6 [Chytridiales sp. JEL 0842]
MKLNVGTITGRSFLVDVERTDTIRDVKRIIEEEEDIPTEAQILIFKEKALADGVSVSDLGLRDGANLQLTVKMTGGPGPLTKMRRTPLKRDDSVLLLLCQQSDGLYMLEFNMKNNIETGRPGGINRVYKLSSSLQNMLLGQDQNLSQELLPDSAELVEQLQRYRFETALNYAENQDGEASLDRSGLTSSQDVRSSTSRLQSSRRVLSRDKRLRFADEYNFMPESLRDGARPGSGESQTSCLSFLSSISSTADPYEEKHFQDGADFSDTSTILTDMSYDADIIEDLEGSDNLKANIDDLREQILHFASLMPPMGNPIQAATDHENSTSTSAFDDIPSERLNFAPKKKSRPATAISIMRIPGFVNTLLTYGPESRPSTAGKVRLTSPTKSQTKSPSTPPKSSSATATLDSANEKEEKISEDHAPKKRPVSVKFQETTAKPVIQPTSISEPQLLTKTKKASRVGTAAKSQRPSTTSLKREGSSPARQKSARVPIVKSREKLSHETSQTNSNSSLKVPLKCFSCQKKLRLSTSFKCKCHQTFCSTHRYTDRHKCPYDYKGAAKEVLQKENPKVVSSKQSTMEKTDDNFEDPAVIKPGVNVLIRMPSNNYKVVQLAENSTVNLGKFGSFPASELIGYKFNAPYEIYGRNQVRSMQIESLEIQAAEDANNQEVNDTQTSQKLTQEEIEAMKLSSLSGELEHKTLIQKITENSETFDGKTGFAKQKYIKRKEKKFSKSFFALEPSARNMCEFYFAQKAQRIKDMRQDTLAQMMCMGNITASSKVLLVDSTQGILLASVLERTGGMGNILALTDTDTPNFELLKHCNFDEKTRASVATIPWERLEPQFDEDPDYIPEDCKNVEAFQNRKKVRAERFRFGRELLADRDFDCLMVASQFDAADIIERLTPYLGGSRQIVVYAPYQESIYTPSITAVKAAVIARVYVQFATNPLPLATLSVNKAKVHL